MQKKTLTDDLNFPKNEGLATGFLAAGVIGVLASFIGYFVNSEQFFFSYLTSFTFVATIGLGALFFVMLQHVTRSSWSVVMRRIPETMSYFMFVVGIFFVPLLFGIEYLYEWARPEVIAEDELVQHKQPYLNTPFFIIRNILYFVVWAWLGYRLYQTSINMDHTGDWGIQTRQRTISAPGILLFGFTLSFASFDWMMSMDSHWFSTIFGVYFFAMSFQAFLAVIVLLFIYMQRKGILLNTITKPHHEDVGKLLFGFTVFYAYIAFSQYFLLYYANIPEATIWFYDRFQGSWGVFAMSMLIGRFAIPFLLLLSKPAKSNLKLLGGLSMLIIVLHFMEIYWIIMPILHEPGMNFHWLDVATLLGLVGVAAGLFFNQLKKHDLVPKNDPKLLESLNKH